MGKGLSCEDDTRDHARADACGVSMRQCEGQPAKAKGKWCPEEDKGGHSKIPGTVYLTPNFPTPSQSATISSAPLDELRRCSPTLRPTKTQRRRHFRCCAQRFSPAGGRRFTVLASRASVIRSLCIEHGKSERGAHEAPLPLDDGSKKALRVEIWEVALGATRLGGTSIATNTYDEYGNLISDGTSTYTYDLENRLVAVAGGGLCWAIPRARMLSPIDVEDAFLLAERTEIRLSERSAVYPDGRFEVPAF